MYTGDTFLSSDECLNVSSNKKLTTNITATSVPPPPQEESCTIMPLVLI